MLDLDSSALPLHNPLVVLLSVNRMAVQTKGVYSLTNIPKKHVNLKDPVMMKISTHRVTLCPWLGWFVFVGDRVSRDHIPVVVDISRVAGVEVLWFL